jgi:hypothetical protein
MEIFMAAGQTPDEHGPFDAKNPFDRVVRLACSHAALSAEAIGRQAGGGDSLSCR